MLAAMAVIVFNGFLAIATGVAYRIPKAGEIIDRSTLFFQGPFLHANVAGPFCALAAVFLFTFWLTSPYRRSWLALLLALPLVYFLWLSRSRTGLLSLVIGLAIAFLTSGVAPRLKLLRRGLGRRRGQVIAGGVLLAVAVVAYELSTGGTLTLGVVRFLNKYDRTATEIEMEDVLGSRQSVIVQQWETFLERPLTGIGFQVAKSEDFVRNATLFSAGREGVPPDGALGGGGTARIGDVRDLRGDALRGADPLRKRPRTDHVPHLPDDEPGGDDDLRLWRGGWHGMVVRRHGHPDGDAPQCHGQGDGRGG